MKRVNPKDNGCECKYDPEVVGDCECCGADNGEPCLHRQSMLEFFDVRDIKHLKAYRHLQQTGVWPRGFWEEMQRRSVKFETCWEHVIKSKLADAYLAERFPKDTTPVDREKSA